MPAVLKLLERPTTRRWPRDGERAGREVLPSANFDCRMSDGTRTDPAVKDILERQAPYNRTNRHEEELESFTNV